jgi:hypothetical protein
MPKARLCLHPFTTTNRRLGQGMKYFSHHANPMRQSRGFLDLAQDLGLSNDERIQATRHLKKMIHSVPASLNVKTREQMLINRAIFRSKQALK